MFQDVATRPKPSLTHQLLRGCRNCGSPHPIVLRAADPTTCPDCGLPAVAPDNARTDQAVLTGFRVRAGMFLLAIGERLQRLARQLRKD